MLVSMWHNNSGGMEWLSTEDWENLKHAGWESFGCMSIIKECPSEDAAKQEFEQITGHDANAQGCNCCGRPFYFMVEPYEEEE